MDGLGLCIKKIPEDTPCAGTSSQPDPPLVKTLQVDLCRLCANVPDSPIEIYNAEGITPQLSEIINEYLPVKVSPEDELSLCCCSNCASTILSFHEFALSCVEAQKRLPVAISEEPKPIPIVIPPAEPDQQMATVDDEEGQLMDDDEFNEMNEDDESEEETKLLVPGTSDDTESSQDTQPTSSNRKETTDNEYKETDEAKIRNDDGTVCNICDETLETGSNLVDHYMIHNKMNPYNCDICNTSFTHHSDLKSHVETTHKQDKRYICEGCNIRFRNRKSLKNHMAKCKEGGSDNDNNTYPGSDEDNEESETEAQKTNTCVLCNKSFATMTNLKRHVESVHMHIKKFECDICNKRFFTRFIRDEHMDTHSNNRPLKCDMCDKYFKNRSGLRDHKKIHLNKKRKKKLHTCNICDKQIYNLNQHLAAVHTQIRNFECDFCDKIFLTKFLKDEHMATHNDERPVKCDICDKCFKNRSGLTVHKRRHFPQKRKNKMYRCNICDKQIYNLNRHLAAVHKVTPEKYTTVEQIKNEFDRAGIIENDTNSKESEYGSDDLIIKEELPSDSEDPLQDDTMELSSY